MFLHGGAEENTFLGSSRYRVIEPDELGINAVSVAASGGTVESRQVSIAGFPHHQICVQANLETNTLTLAIALGRFVGAGAFTSEVRTTFLDLFTIRILASRYVSGYFGIARGPNSTTVGHLRFGSTAVIRITNNHVSPRIFTAWLESMG